METRDGWGGAGTVSKVTKNVIRVQWDDGFETPVHPLELAHTTEGTEKDRSTLAKESAAAHPTENLQEEESVMTNLTHFTDKELAAELDRRGIKIPAGFTTGWAENYDGEEFSYCTGPKASSGTVTVETFWSIPGGIEYHITNDRHADNGIFNDNEVIELGRLLREVVAATKVSTAENAGIKICATCNEGKALSEFSKHISNRDGLQNHCKSCAAEYYAKGGTNA
ncbi:hypothetical protein [Glutamicibacter uratoxydans]|uniref:hypothetical protein n=1 Tax=Glutamicibacter uratoxydans TaxID=43667 RepID=UPI003D6EA069